MRLETTTTEEAPLHAPRLDEREERKADQHITANAQIIHEVIRRHGEDELRRTSSGLAWSGLAAGLSMGFSLIAEGLLNAYLPDAQWKPLLTKLGYPVGFVIVIIGRQQLFTENTLTPIIPLLARRNVECFKNVLRLWAVVLAGCEFLVAGPALLRLKGVRQRAKVKRQKCRSRQRIERWYPAAIALLPFAFSKAGAARDLQSVISHSAWRSI